MQYLIIAIAAVVLIIVFAKNKPHKEENRIRNEELIQNLNANIEKYTDKSLESSISFDGITCDFDCSKLSDLDKKRMALAMKGKVLYRDASYTGSPYTYRHRYQIDCLKWVEKTLHENGVPGRYRISDATNANDMGSTLDVDVLKGSHALTWKFDVDSSVTS